jgi:Mn-containing catalase
MHNSSDNPKYFNVKFFDLLLAQFGGAEGELPMAIAYLTQATTEIHPARKAALVRIAREKIKHADTLGSMLLQMAHKRSGPLSAQIKRSELNELLVNKDVRDDHLKRASTLLKNFMSAEHPQPTERHYAADPTIYLAANIATEERQIAAYEQLAGLTTNSHFLSALNFAKARQILHREEFLDLLSRVTTSRH